MSGPDASPRFVITADTRRRWPADAKRTILTEARTRPVSEVARRHGISPSLVYRWRRQLVGTERPRERPAATRFIPVALPAPAGATPGPMRSSGIIEIELGGGRRIRVDAAVDVGVLKRIVDALEGR